MKKKLLSLCLVLALGTTAVIGGTLAYFTDQDQVNNTFAIGNLDIELVESAGVKDADGNEVQEIEEITDFDENNKKGFDYEDLMPSYEIVKTPVVKNNGDYAAYVRVAITMNNYLAMNAAIDDVYEKQGGHALAQEKYTEIFDGWGINHYAKKDNVQGYDNDVRFAMAQRTTGVLAIDSVRCPGTPATSAGYQWNTWNTFKAGTELTSTTCATAKSDTSTYYAKALDEDSVTFVLYLKLDAGEEYSLFNGLNIPAEFTNDQMKMFEDLEINVYADAIQADGFNNTVDEATGDVTKTAWVKAFEALEAAHPIGWWN